MFLDNFDADNSELFGAVEAKQVETVTYTKAPKARKAYLIQSQANVLRDPSYDDDNIKAGMYFVEGDPTAEPGTPEAKGYATRTFDVFVRDWKYSRDFRWRNQPICWSPDNVLGYPSRIGEAAPYNIKKGQACASCKWLSNKTADDAANNGYCSLVYNVEVIAPDRNKQPVTAWMSFKNTAGVVGRRILEMYKERTRDGKVKPFPIRLTSQLPQKGATYLIPVLVEDEEAK